MVATAPRLGDTMGRRQHRRAPQAVADQDLRSPQALAHEVGRRHQVVEVGGEVGGGEIALALPQPGEVEAQHRDPLVDQRRADAAERLEVFRAGEAVREQGPGVGLERRPVDATGEPLATSTGKVDASRLHGGASSPRRFGVGPFLPRRRSVGCGRCRMRRTAPILTWLLLLALLASRGAAAAPPQHPRRYLSGHGTRDAVPWSFHCTAGRRAGEQALLPVPSCWQLHGFGSYAYGLLPERRRVAESGIYRRAFTLPREWRGRRIRLVFEGVMTDATVWLDGALAGPPHHGAFYPFSYDVTSMVRWGRENHLEVRVDQRSAVPSVQRAEREADYWVFGGIFRPVYLEAEPLEAIRRLAVDARADGALTATVALATPAVRAERLGGQLRDLDGQPVGAPFVVLLRHGASRAVLRTRLAGIAPWNPESPRLYRLELSLLAGDGTLLDRIGRRIGFRTVELRPGDGLYLDGRRILLRGVARHSFWPDSGRATDPAISRRTVERIRAMNANAVRTAHYPPDEHFLDACDEAGLLVIDELAGWHDAYATGVGSELLEAMVERDADHPSVIAWANGNEGGWNRQLDPLFARLDPQHRPVLHPGGVYGGVDSRHYPTYAELTRRLAGAELAERWRDALSGHRELLLPTEMLHALWDGGGAAGLADFWRLLRAAPNALGGVLWSWADEGVRRSDRGGALDTDGNHAADGVTSAYEEPEASWSGVRELWSPVVLAAEPPMEEGHDAHLRVRLENRFDFTRLDACRLTWRLRALPAPGWTSPPAPAPHESGWVRPPALAPGEHGSLLLPLPAGWRSFDLLELGIEDPRGVERMRWSVALHPWRPAATAGTAVPGWVERGEDVLLLRGQGAAARFDGHDGHLISLRLSGHDVPLGGPRAVFGAVGPAPPDDSPSSSQLRIVPGPAGGRAVQLRSSGALRQLTWSIEGADLRLDYRLAFNGLYDYAGLGFDYPATEVRRLRWVGQGPWPVWKNRLAGNRLGLWRSSGPTAGRTAGERLLGGCYAGVRWATLSGAGRNLTILLAAEPGTFLQVSQPPPHADPGHAVAPLPDTTLAVLHAIPGIGSKFHRAAELGPAGEPTRLRAIQGTLWLRGTRDGE